MTHLRIFRTAFSTLHKALSHRRSAGAVFAHRSAAAHFAAMPDSDMESTSCPLATALPPHSCSSANAAALRSPARGRASPPHLVDAVRPPFPHVRIAGHHPRAGGVVHTAILLHALHVLHAARGRYARYDDLSTTNSRAYERFLYRPPDAVHQKSPPDSCSKAETVRHAGRDVFNEGCNPLVKLRSVASHIMLGRIESRPIRAA